MSRNLHLGAASISFSQPLYIESAASIVSQKEADGPLGDFFDLICIESGYRRTRTMRIIGTHLAMTMPKILDVFRIITRIMGLQ